MGTLFQGCIPGLDIRERESGDLLQVPLRKDGWAMLGLFGVGRYHLLLAAGNGLLQLIAEGPVIAALQAAFAALALSGFDQVFQAARALDGLLATLGAPAVPLHAQLIFALP